MGLTYSITCKATTDLPKHFEMVEGYSAVKRVEKLLEIGYDHITIESGELRYIINNRINCSCLSFPPKLKKCETCQTRGQEHQIYKKLRF